MLSSYLFQPVQNFIVRDKAPAQYTELAAICRKYPVAVPVPVAAKFLGISKDCLRTAIDQNRCPFGFSWKAGERSGYKIPTMAFHSWLTKGTSQIYHDSGGDQRCQ